MNYQGMGTYEHYKGGRYYVQGLALEESRKGQPDETVYVVYRPLTEGSLLDTRAETFWAREIGDFNELIGIDGVKRFNHVALDYDAIITALDNEEETLGGKVTYIDHAVMPEETLVIFYKCATTVVGRGARSSSTRYVTETRVCTYIRGHAAGRKIVNRHYEDKP